MAATSPGTAAGVPSSALAGVPPNVLAGGLPDAVMARLAADRDGMLARLCALLRLPSVGADPACAQGMADTRRFLLHHLAEIGLDDVRLLEPAPGSPGEPVVYGARLRPGRPTLILYGHYDVQPPDPLGAWTTPPFEPTVRDGRLYARGAADVKGSTMIAIETVAAFLALDGACPVGVKLFLEGEEEVGSPSLPGIVARHRDLLAADGVVSADGGRVSLEQPAVNVGCRGLVGLELALATATRDLHSGRFGGVLRNALHEMAALLATLHDAQGRIAVAGFEDDVRLPTPGERAALEALPAPPEAFYGAGGVGGLPHGDPACGLRERLTLRPTLEVNGLWGGYTGQGSKTVIPHQAFAKLTGRLAPGQDPARVAAVLERHLRAACAPGVRLDVSGHEGNAAYTLPPAHPMLLAAEQVLGALAGRPAVRARIGGTLPVSGAFRDGLGLETLMFGFADPDGRQHAPDEFMRLSSIEDGLRAWPMLLAALGEIPAGAFRAG